MEKKKFAPKFANAFAQLGLNVIDDEIGKPLSETEAAQSIFLSGKLLE